MSFSRLAGKTAIVTGAGSGIGRAICQLFAAEGANVGVLDVSRRGIEETLDMLPSNDGKKHCAIEADVTKTEDIRKALQIASKELGTCTVLVNNAGILRGAAFADSKEKDFDEMISVNLKGVYLASREFINSLKGSNEDVRGSLVNVSSMAGKCGFAMNAEYAASKAGVLGLMKSIAFEFPSHRVRCNALLPGFTDTPMADAAGKELMDRLAKRNIPLRRLARPEEIANACLFLASDESSYVHGTCMEVAGGMGI